MDTCQKIRPQWELPEDIVLDAEFHALVDALFDDLEDEIDNLDRDIDIDAGSGILNIVFPNGTTIVISRQIGNHEVWVAAKSGGFHLSMEDNEDWYCKATRERFGTLMSRVLSEQLGEPVSVL